MWLVAPILPVPFAMDLDVRPGKLLPDPAKAGVADHLQRPLPLGHLYLLLEKGVDAKGDHIGMLHGHARIQVRLWPDPVAGVLKHALDLG